MSLKRINKETFIKRKITKWYGHNARVLPWRKKMDKNLPIPYYVFISEFMLQQTTVRAVIPKFNEFIKIWPTIKKLSKITESRILTFWSGLGYYARARNLLKSIKLIAKNHNYIIPKEYNHLIQLPGVGDYTAKAIQGIAYNKPVMPIDSNIERIVTRIYGSMKPIREMKSHIEELVKKLISKKNSSNFIQALMDYGSIICLPNVPICNKCIIQNHCIAFKKKLTNEIPIKKIKSNSKKIKFTRAYIIVNEFNEILVRRRPKKGMLQSMIEVPNDQWIKQKKKLVRNNFIKSLSLKLVKLRKKSIYSFSHFDLYIEVYFTKVRKIKFKNYHWLSLTKIDNAGLPTVMRKIVRMYMSSV